MAEFGPGIAGEVIAQIGAHAGELGGALTRALDVPLSLSSPESLTWSPQQSPVAWNGPGLVIALPMAGSGALALIPAEGGVLPPWCAAPDVTSEAKLGTLAQELGLLLLPEAHPPIESLAKHLPDVQAAAQRAAPAEGAALLKIPLSGTGRQGALWLLWPVKKAKQALLAPSGPPAPAPLSPAALARQAAADEAALDFDERLARLPTYARSLLKIKVPVVVTLASKRKPVEEILQLGLGSILQFDKPCDETLDLEVAESPVAVGEAVKVGDKFGLRVTGVVLPDERFEKVKK